jgi:hypothetical protein
MVHGLITNGVIGFADNKRHIMKLLKASFIFLLIISALPFANGNGLPDSLITIRKDSTFIITANHIAGEILEDSGELLHDYFTDGLLSFPALGDSTQYYIDQARAVIAKVRETQNFIRNLDEASQFSLPVGISKQIGGISYDIAINAIRLRPTYAEIDVFMQFEVPQNNTTLTFMARGIKFTQKGGIVGDAKLELVGDYGINFNGSKTQLVLKGSATKGNTYVTMDCDGFKEMGLDAEVKFSRDLLRPEMPDGSQGQGNLTAAFKTVLSNWNDLVVQVSLPAFQVAGLEGVGFSVQDAVFDFSDLRNAPNVIFPADYKSTQMLPDNPNLWRGFYLRELTVRLPQEFKSKDNARTSFSASNVLIDNLGFTGTLKATKLLSLEKGDMNGWAFSVDAIEVGIKANQLTSAGFNGRIVIPVSDEKTPFEYNALISDGGNYLFTVSPAKDISFNLWSAAHVDIYKASYLEVKIADHKFLPKANLHGRMAVQGKLSSGGQGVELANITFEDLQIQSVKPYIKVGNFSFGSEAAQQKMAGFPISIHDIGLKSISDTEVGLDFNLKLNLVGENNGAFAADAGLTLVGKMDSERGWQSWKYKTILVREIAVDIDGGAFKINGKLIFYRDDKTYGDGFNGNVKAEFTPGIKVTATAIFGNVKNLRYWYADAMINFPSAIPIFTGVGIYGFGGGAYFAMKMDNQGIGSALGKTASGVVYVPDDKAGLGLKAIVNLGSMPKPEAFNADVTFEIAFFKGGGVRYISFGGNGYIATPGIDINMDKMKAAAGKMVSAVKTASEKLGPAKGLLDDGGDNNSLTQIFGEVGDKAGQKGQISARVLISYDFENHVLHGNFEVYVNVAGGIISGVGPGGRAGWSVLHFAPHEWYIWAGTPDDRVGVKIGIGSVSLAATSYFMVGTKILNSPPPPPEVADILGGMDLDYMKDLNALGTGPGFAFGAGLSMKTGDLTFLMFYSNFSAGLGFDIMLKNYGDVHCKGSDKRIGINGWYANGQSYGYFEGAIGIRVKVFGRRKKVEILSIGAATVMQAKLPNPFWMRGIVGGRFSVLGGLVKGHCKFQVTLGKECELIKSEERALDDVQVIAQLTPTNGELDVNVFNAPQVVFNMAVEKEFVLAEENIQKSFRIKLDKFTITQSGVAIAGKLEWNENHDVLAFNSFDILPEKKELKSSVQVSFEELLNGAWVPVLENGKPVIETSEITFTTGDAPKFIPLDNVDYSYPVIGQMNFYRDESTEGYIKLKKGQPNLFEKQADWKQVGRFTDKSGTRTEYAFSYANAVVTFTIPASGLKTETLYAFEILNVPLKSSGAIDRNVSQVTSKVDTGDASVETEVVKNKAEGSITDLQEKSIFTSYFRTSKYTSFSKKVDALTFSTPASWQVANGIDELQMLIAGPELFDQFETKTMLGADNKILFEATLDNTWYQTKIKSIVYDDYPIMGTIKAKNRVPETLGLPPVRAIWLNKTSDLAINQNNSEVLGVPETSVVMEYNLPLEMVKDFIDFRQQAANLSVTTSSARINTLLVSNFTNIHAGNYVVKIKYTIPGLTKKTIEKAITLNYTY